jgi:hypothetical protein
MGVMAEISGARVLITEEEMITGAAASEGAMNHVGGSLNLVLNNEVACYRWTMNGPYFNGGSPQTKVDGEYILMRPMTLVGVHMYNQVAGASGTLELDVLRLPSGGGSASIFSTTPKLVYTSGNDSTMFRDFVSGTTPWNPAGCTVPVLAISDFNTHDKLVLNIQQIQSGGQNAGLALYFRLR